MVSPCVLKSRGACPSRLLNTKLIVFFVIGNSVAWGSVSGWSMRIVCFQMKNRHVLVSLTHLLAAESYKETQVVTVKEEPMEVDIQDSPASISPSRNVGYSTLMGREKTEPLQKLPEGRVPPERNLFSQDISVKMASELLFQLSGR